MTERLLQHYEVEEEVGRGRFGVIRRCRKRESGEEYACKSIARADLQDATDRECAEKEVKMMKFVAELFQRIVEKRSPFSENESAALLKSLMEALRYCHSKGVAHRDLKPDNILFKHNSSFPHHIKLADFGHASSFSPGQRMRGIVGTPHYVAPEVLAGDEYNEKVDVWSAGVVVYILLSGIPPFMGETPQEIFERVMRGHLRFPTDRWLAISQSAKDLLRRMIAKDVAARFSTDQVLEHPWIANNVETRSGNDEM
eukprot:Gb_32592 [translate_table: standard]